MSSTSFSPARRRALSCAGALALTPAAAWSRLRPIAAVADPVLAVVYEGQVDPALCLVSEKYDGVRAI